MAATTLTAGTSEIAGKFRRMLLDEPTRLRGLLNIGLNGLLLLCAGIVLATAARRWWGSAGRRTTQGATPRR